MDPVLRFDSIPIQQSKVKTTPQGFLSIPATVTKTGVFTYQRDGKPFKELRLPEEVFNTDSMQSLIHAPVTDNHPYDEPNGMVTPENARKLTRGMVAGDVMKSGDRFLNATIIVQDAELIDKIKSKQVRHLSAGYQCKLDCTPGEYEGQHYDAIQRDVVYNHVAAVTPNRARGGEDTRFHMDGLTNAEIETEKLYCALVEKKKSVAALAKHLQLTEEAFISRLDSWDLTDEQVQKIKGFLGATQMKKFRLDGVEIEVDDKDASAFERGIAKIEAARDTAITKADQLQAKLDATQAKLDQATAPTTIASLVAARVSLVDRARKILGAEAKLDAKSDQEIKIETIKKSVPEFDPKDKSADYLTARFDAIVETAPARALDGFKPTGEKIEHLDASDDTAVIEAKKKARAALGNAWQTEGAE